MSILLFLVGLVFALGLGQVIVSGFLNWVRTTSQVPRIRPNAGVPNWIVGLFERSFAFALAFANVQGAYVLLGLASDRNCLTNFRMATACIEQ
jgi:amino acid transporter